MKLAIATITLLLSGTASFAPSRPTLVGRGITSSAAIAVETTTAIFAGPEEEQGGLDLDLSEMFDMFDAADKGKDFDKVIKEVKKEKKD
ncbi:hypothetical protein ACHAXA_004883 [Cyclostephanos tholiformis]|uniref:Uncharacterized protein n=1 Tax=Cyclostephanos tholiformis TaxID=382380 RepID=A0ABD3RS36_9STRA